MTFRNACHTVHKLKSRPESFVSQVGQFPDWLPLVQPFGTSSDEAILDTLRAKSSAFFPRQMDFQLLVQAEDKYTLVRSGADVGVKINNLGCGDITDDLEKKRLGFFDKRRPHLFDQFATFTAFGELLLGGSEHPPETDKHHIIDDIAAGLLWAAAHVIDLKLHHGLAYLRFDFAFGFHQSEYAKAARRERLLPVRFTAALSNRLH
jgi:hypothetical protein